MRNLAVRTPLAALAALVIAALALAAPRAHAQPAFEPVVDVRFEGGTMEAYIAKIREAVEAADSFPLNIVWSGEAAREAAVEPIRLRQVDVSTAIDVAIPIRGGWRVVDGGTLYQDFEVKAGAAGNPVYVIKGQYEASQQLGSIVAGQSAPASLRVFPMADFSTDEAEIDAVVGAITTALELGDARSQPEMRFHPETALLIVRGTDNQIATIQRVLDAAFESVTTRSRRDEDTANAVRNLELELAQLESRRQQSLIEMDQIVQLLARAEANEGQTRPEATIELRARLQSEEAALNLTQERVRLLGRQLAEIRSDVASASPTADRARRTYNIRVGDRDRRRALEIVSAIASISPNVDPSLVVEDPRGNRAAEMSITADDAGHRAIARVLRAAGLLADGQRE